MMRGYLLVVGLLLGAIAGTLQAAPLNGRDPRDDVFYQYMPIAWRDSDNDASRFGDFGGMTASLDYLQNLGITAVWMNPIFPSASYHGYQHGRADQLNSWFGTEPQFWSFVQAAHARSIKVFIDFVVYQIDTTAQPYFPSAYNNPASPYDAWLAFTNAANTTYYGGSGTSWNGQSHSYINWNFNNANPTNLEITWALKWLDPNNDGDPSDGIDGYRLDHVSYNDATESSWGYNIGWWNNWKIAIKARNPDAFTFAEQADWGNNGVNLLSAHDATLTKPFLFAARTAISGGAASGLYSNMLTAVNQVPAGHTFMGSVGDHDVDRLASAVGSTGTTNVTRCKTAAAVLLTMPFPPIIYYGDEIGMLGTKANYGGDANDIPMREPFKWNAVAGPPMSNYYVLNSAAFNGSYSKNNDGRSVQEQQGVTGSLLETYRTLITTRKNHIALRRGSYNPITVSGTGSSNVWAFLRYAPDPESLIVLINLGTSSKSITLNLSSFNLPAGSSTVQDLLTNQTFTTITAANKSAYPITIPGSGFLILNVNLATVSLPPGPYDGADIPSDFNAFNLVATQNNVTGFGDNICELNQLFAHPVTGGLRVGITGDLVTDGTSLALLLDTTTGGQNILNFPGFVAPPGGPDHMSGLKLDAGFTPDHMIYVNTNGGSIFVDQFMLTSGGYTKTYRGKGTVNSGAGTLTGATNPNGMMVAMNNTNVLGVTDTSVANAATATTGFEMFLPYADIGVSATPPRGTIRIAAFIVRTSGEVSNQWLTGLGGGRGSLGLVPDMTTIPGQQFAVVPLDLPGDLNGDGYVDDADFNLFDACFSGPDSPHNGSTTCLAADFNDDNDVDQTDFGVFQRCLLGSDTLSNPNCAN